MTSTDFAVRASAHRNRTEPTGETEMSSAIKSTALVREYGEVTAVDGVDLDVAAGEIYGFLGPNGAGKSTTVRMLCTLARTHERLGDGRRLRRGRRTRRACGCASASRCRRRRSIRARPAPSCCACKAGSTACRERDANRRVAELGELIDIGDALDRRISTYSGGMRRRLDLAAALVHNPADPVPRRAHDRPRPGQPGRGVGGGSPAQRRAGHDDLPHDAVPRGGRRARRPGRHHRRRSHRRRRHADRAQAVDRHRRHRRSARRRRVAPSARRSSRCPACSRSRPTAPS